MALKQVQLKEKSNTQLLEIIEKRANDQAGDELTFYNTKINPLTRAYYPQFPHQGDGPTVLGQVMLRHEQQGLNIDSETTVTKWCGEAIDYGLTIDGLGRLDGF